MPAVTIRRELGVELAEYRYVGAGDALPLHLHDFDHTCTVIDGAVRIFAQGLNRRIGPGECAVLKVGIPHEIVALAPGTITVNVRKA